MQTISSCQAAGTARLAFHNRSEQASRLSMDSSDINDRETVLHWYCLRSSPKREHYAASQLADRTGIETFAPRLTLRRPTLRGNPVPRTEALFPGYLFARFDLGSDSRFVASTPDILGIVRFGSHTPEVPAALISLLRTHASGPNLHTPILAPGDWIEVLCGSLAGSNGRLLSLDSSSQRAWVLLSLLGQDLRVKLPVAALRREGPASLDFPPQLLATCA